MSILLNGRTVEAILKQNVGNTVTDSTELDISGYLLTLGTLSWEVDEALTKLSLGNLSITVADDTSDTVWTFINSSLTSTSGLLPPWLVLNVDGVQRFIGLIKESPTRNQDASTAVINIDAVDWSSMLEAKRIKSTDNTIINRANTFNDNQVGLAQGTTVSCTSVYNKELRRNHDRATVVLSASEAANFNVNDSVYFYNYNTYTNYNKQFRVIGKQVVDVWGLGSSLCLYLGGGFQWLEHPEDPQNYRQGSTLFRVIQNLSQADGGLPAFVADETYTKATAGITPKMFIKMTYVKGLLPGDVLNKVTSFAATNDSSYSVTVTDVDPTGNLVYIDQPLSGDLVSGVTSFELAQDSLSESVFIPVTDLIESSLTGLATMDYTSYHPATLPLPAFSFISPASPSSSNTHSETLSGISDLQCSLTKFQAVGTASKAWEGIPADGWDTLGTFTKTVNWTDQRSSAPSYLLPYYSLPGDAPAGSALVRGHSRYAGLHGFDDDPDVDPAPATNAAPIYKYLYDYSNLRYYEYRYGTTDTVTFRTWSGSAWSGTTTLSTSGIGDFLDWVPFSYATTSSGSGYGILALYADGTVKTILSTVSYTHTLNGDTKDSNGKLQVILKQTSNGVYYVTPSGYGKIEIAAGAITSKFVKLTNSPITNNNNLVNVGSTTLISLNTSTFVYSNSRIICLAKVSYRKAVADERTIDDTYLFQLNPVIQALAKDAVYSTDFIVSNIPRATMAVRSPVSEDIMGFMGGRLFQIATRLPDTIERFNPINQPASALIEFVSAMTNSVAMPTVEGKLKLFTRGYANTSTNITVDVISQTEARWNKHLADCIVIKGFDEKKGVAVSTTQLSGLTISYSNETFIRNSSQAQAIATSYLAFFEVPRKEVEQVWTSSTNPPPWESLSPLDVITINGSGTQKYFLVGLTVDLDTITCTAKLLEKV